MSEFWILLRSVLAGLLLCNAVPHLAAGLRGEAFPTPFATPRGVGRSPPPVNAVWGVFNLGLGLYLAESAYGLSFGLREWGGLAGGLAAAVYLSRHFGAVRGRD